MIISWIPAYAGMTADKTMKTKNIIKKNIVAFLMLMGIFVSPSLALAGPAWGVGVDSNGGISVGIGSSAGAIAATNGSWGGGYGVGGPWTLTNPYGLPSGSVLGILSNLLFWLLAIFAIAGIVGFVLSGIFYLLAGADEDNAKKGKAGMRNSIIGIIVGLSGFVIMQAVAALLGGSSKTF